ncbi:aminopeptidase [Candidatus Woesearchaeota archaeon]|nr:aminopeptidase [Candidatus Woesearchaeota archaeon]
MTNVSKGTIEYGARNGLENALNLRDEENVVIVTDEASRHIGDVFLSQASAISPSGVISVFVMEDFGARPLTGLDSRLKQALESANVTLYVAECKEGELPFRRALITTAMKYGARHGHAPDINNEIMLSGMQVDIPESNRLCRELYERLTGVSEIRIVSDAGTDLTLKLNPDYRWEPSDWRFSQGHWYNIPSGEVFTAPFDVHGVYVVDGVLGDHFDTKYGSLASNPVTYVVRDGKIIGIWCPMNVDLEKEIRNYVFSNPNERKIGEIGIGALDVKQLVHRMLQDEKKLGTVHIAHGDNYPEKTNAPDNGAVTHCDGVILKPTLLTSRREYILKEGIYQKL